MDIHTLYGRAAAHPAPRGCSPRTVRDDPRRHAFAYTERHLQCVWYDPGWRPAAMTTLDGESVRVLDPGRWNLQPGPDFLDAVLEIGPGHRQVRGDVEIHVHPREWRNHEHARNRAFLSVAAHVSYFPARLDPGQLPAGTVQIALQDALCKRPSFSFDAIDVTAYPHAALNPSPAPCAVEFQRLSPPAADAVLDAAGEARLAAKTLHMEQAIARNGREQAFYEELMGALGYRLNPSPFRELARRLPLAAWQAEASGGMETAYALLLGVAGLLPEPQPEWHSANRAFARRLWDIWWKRRETWASHAMHRNLWILGRGRPQNNPLRRLAAAAALFTRHPPDVWPLFEPAGNVDSAWLQDAASRFQNLRFPYWLQHLTLGGTRLARPVALLGQNRTASILANVIVPFAAACGTDIRPILGVLPTEPDNHIVRQTALTLFGRDDNPAHLRCGLRSQGLLQIFHDFCLGRKGSCETCPFLAALRAM